MFLYLVFLVALLKFGQSQSQCVREIRSLKNDLQLELRGVVREEITVSIEKVREQVEDKATKEDVQALKRNLTAGIQLFTDILASHLNVTIEELVRLLSDKETKEDAHHRASELLQAFNFSVATGNKITMDALLQIIASQETIKSATTLTSGDSVDPADQCVTRDEVRDVIRAKVKSVVRAEVQSLVNNCVAEVRNNIAPLLGAINPGTDRHDRHDPALSCRHIPQWKPSGVYWIQGIDGNSSQQYCDMTRMCCGRTGGWMRVANLDMKVINQQCPLGFRLVTSPRRSCGRPGPAGCVSTTFPVHGVEYSRVCGKIIGYQFGTPDAFQPYHIRQTMNIDSHYIEGVSLTHGSSPRKHIWTFAAARDEVTTNHFVCPCTRPDRTYTGRVPPFIGQDYFCETGSRNIYQFRFYSEDPLWDGQGCGAQSTCCSFNNPPWFCKELPQPTRDDIELRLCAGSVVANEDTPLEVVEIYVQ